MKLKPPQIDSFIKNPDANIQAALIFGQDTGLIAERFTALSKAISPNPNDPFLVTDLTASTIQQDPTLLFDHVAELSLTGERKLVRIRDADNNLTKHFKALFAQPPGGAFIVISAEGLRATGSLCKLFETEKTAAALPCYQDDRAGLEALIQRDLSEKGLSLEADALAYIAAHLGADRLATRSELEKLALYMGDEKTVTLVDAQAVIGDQTQLAMDDLAYACAGGEIEQALAHLDRLFREGQAAVGVLRALSNHFLKLYRVAGKVVNGERLDSAMAQLRPPIFFKKKNAFSKQVALWTLPLLTKALARLQQAETDCKTSHMPDEAICTRTIMQLTALAAKRQKRR